MRDSARELAWTEAHAAARFWLRTLDDCECPPEHYPTGDVRTDHDPFCSTVLKNVAAELKRLAAVEEAARDLYAQVEMDESVGVCLTDRVPSLRLGAALNGDPDA